MTHPCPAEHCDRTAPGHAVVCGACEAELLRALAEVPALAAELATTLSRQGSRSPGGGGSEIPLPFDARASEAEAVLRSALVGWVRMLLDGLPVRHGPLCAACEHPSCGYITYRTEPADTLAEITAWLSERRTRLLGHHAAAEAHGEITAAVRLAQRVIDARPGMLYAGPCTGCGYDLLAALDSVRVACRTCGTGHRVADQREHMLAALHDRLDTAPQIASILEHFYTPPGFAPPTPVLVRKWISRERLLPRGEDRHGRPLYAVDEAALLLAAKHERDARRADEREKLAS